MCRFTLQFSVNPALSDKILSPEFSIFTQSLSLDKLSCHYLSANVRVPSETVRRGFRRSMEILTFDDMWQCLSCAVQSTGVEVGVFN
jgi:hypothetical protein